MRTPTAFASDDAITGGGLEPPYRGLPREHQLFQRPGNVASEPDTAERALAKGSEKGE